MRHRIARNTFTVFSANIIQAALGFSVSAFVAATYGSSGEVDAFFIAAPLPILLGQFTLSISLVAITPHYQRLSESHGRTSALRKIAPLFWSWSLLVLTLTTIGYFAIEPLAIALAPGFDSQRLTLLVTYLRWAVLAAPFISLAGFLQALENADGHFFRPAFARPLITAIAFGAVVTAVADQGLEPFFIGLFVGAALTSLWQFLEVRSFGSDDSASSFPLTLRGAKQVWTSIRSTALSMALARGMGQGAELGLQIIATLATAGVVAVYGFSFKIAAIPLMLSISLALALFPAQSAAYAKNNPAESLRILWRGVNALAILGAFFGGFFFVWAEPLVILLYERGDFNPALTANVAQTIRIFSLGLMVIAANNAIANGFWAAKRMKERIILESFANAILLILAGLFIKSHGPIALAGSYVTCYTFLFFVGLWMLEKNESPSKSRMWAYLTRLATFGRVAAVTGICILLGSTLSPSNQFFRELSHIAQIGVLGIGGLGFALVFFAGLYALKVDEAYYLLEKLTLRLSRKPRALDGQSDNVDASTTKERQRADV